MEIKLKRAEEIYVIEIHGEMDMYNASQLKTVFNKMLEKNINKILVDFLNCEYIDSTGVGTLLGLFASAKEKKLSFFLTNVTGTVLKVLTLTKLHEYLPLEQNIESAIQRIRKGN
ncbi:MAG: STAS domain-containing protein [Spirochaetales bacterium]